MPFVRGVSEFKYNDNDRRFISNINGYGVVVADLRYRRIVVGTCQPIVCVYDLGTKSGLRLITSVYFVHE